MKNTLQHILEVDSYAKELTDEYDKKKKEIAVSKNEQLRLLDQHLATVADEERLHYKRLVEDFKEENTDLLSNYQKKAAQIKDLYSKKKEEILRSLTNNLMKSDYYDGKL